jgi:VanZ family protein
MLDLRIVWHVVTEPELLAIIAVTLLVAWPLGTVLARRNGCARAVGVLFVVVVGSVLAATTTHGSFGLPYAFELSGVRPYLAQFADPGLIGSGLRGFGATLERLANIGLFLPLGLVATLLWRRPLRAVAFGVALTFAVEGWQAYIGRGGEFIDVLHNSVGALLGAVIGAIWLRASTYLAMQGTV